MKKNKIPGRDYITENIWKWVKRGRGKRIKIQSSLLEVWKFFIQKYVKWKEKKEKNILNKNNKREKILWMRNGKLSLKLCAEVEMFTEHTKHEWYIGGNVPELSIYGNKNIVLKLLWNTTRRGETRLRPESSQNSLLNYAWERIFIWDSTCS